MNPAPRLKYSLVWAKNVVKQLYDKHARATELVLEILDISEHQLAVYLASDDPVFPAIRDLIKRVEIWTTIRGIKATYYTLVDYLALRLENFTGLGEKDRLISRVKSVMLKKQGSREGTGGLPAESSPPSTFLVTPNPNDLPGQLFLEFE